jgi:hypothetical protein
MGFPSLRIADQAVTLEEANFVPDQILPGPCPATGCPPPTEIDCIIVDKVYASCVQTVSGAGTFTIVGCTGPISCSVDLSTSTCTVGAVTPTGVDDINNITFVVSLDLSVLCAGLTIPSTETIVLTTTVPLYNPNGTTPSCTILTASCTCVVVGLNTVQCSVTVCLLTQTTATVQLLVPTYGFCVPQPCEVGPLLPCPPSPLYPPQQFSQSSG